MYAQFRILNIPTGQPQHIMPYRDKLLLFMRSGQVYESADTGTTWLAKSNIGGLLKNFYTNDTLIFLRKGSFLQKSTNGGQSWQALNTDTTIQIKAAWGRHMMAVGYDYITYNSKFFVSHDFGVTWQNKSDSLFNSSCSNGICYYGSGQNKGTFYVFSPNTKYKSINGGFTWQAIPNFVPPFPRVSLGTIYPFYNKSLAHFVSTDGSDAFKFYKNTDTQNNNWQYEAILDSPIDYQNNFFAAPPYHAIIETKTPYTHMAINYSLDTMQTWKIYCENCYPMATYDFNISNNTLFHKNRIFTIAYNNVIYRNLQPFPPILLGTQSNKSVLNTVILNWTDADSTETNYIVERKINAGSWTVLASLPRNTQVYTDATAAANSTYQYRVKAINDFGSSPYLNSANVFTTTENENLKENLSVFPNPSENGTFYIQNSNFVPKILTITNVQGQTLLRYNNELPNKIDLSQYPDGIYFIKADTQTVRIVKNK